MRGKIGRFCAREEITVPPASACLSVCLSILGEERRFLYFYFFIFFYRHRHSTARFIFPKTSAVQTGTFLNNLNAFERAKKVFSEKNTWSFVYSVPSFSSNNLLKVKSKGQVLNVLRKYFASTC